jgi:5-methyltetrahydropteroyltriglutamate--homocysteine methyltransferase
MSDNLPILPTSVIGSYAIPGWLWTALEAVDAGKYGDSDKRELFDDAVNVAIWDQEKAGVDIISDGEMRRWYFVQSFYRRMEGLVLEEPLRKTGLYSYDSVPRYRLQERVTVPHGLGIIDEFKYLRANTNRRLKATCPGPLTISIHIRETALRGFYKDRLELCWDFAEVINAELKGLVEAGADYVQIDEPSFAIIPGQIGEYIALFNKCVEGVNAKIAYHVCFGNLSSRPRGKRRYGWMFPQILEAKCDELVFEFANREMKEIELCQEIAQVRQVGAGLIDVKSFYVEKPEDVAERIRETLQFVPAEKLIIVPDCGFFQLPRWVAFAKLKAMVAGTKMVRRQLTGQET